VISAELRMTLEDALGDRIRFDVPMAEHTSLGVGGPADALATPADRADLALLLRLCSTCRIPHAVIGGGFNTLVDDGGVEAVMVKLGKLRSIEERPMGGLRAEAGVSHHRLIRFCIERGLSGLEYGAGIPGSVGGWITMNAGIGTREAVDVVREIEVMAPSGKRRSHLGIEKLNFGYRSLRGVAPGSVIVSVLFGVSVSTPAAVRAEVKQTLTRRAESQPLDQPSCGSVFKNPPGDFAGRLVESAGLKGERVGGAQISPVHANFIVNLGGATSSDVVSLVRRAQERVERASGIHLEPEVRILGRPA
jgi:UDP-N-acetylmuramate dehydrogenase